jgi:hypothetical protein
VVLEHLDIAHIAPQPVHALVPAHLGHLEQRRAPRSGAREETGSNPPQSMRARLALRQSL